MDEMFLDDGLVTDPDPALFLFFGCEEEEARGSFSGVSSAYRDRYWT